MLTPSEMKAVKQIFSTNETMERWRSRSREVEKPLPGSQLDLDDQIWHYFPVSEIARQSLVASTQHLNLACAAIKQADIYPSAHYTVLRGGLIGACQAVWIMGPDDRHERQQRALRVIFDFYKQSTKYAGRRLTTSTPPDQDDVDFLKERREQCRQLWDRTETLTSKQTLNLTNAITWASKFTLGPGDTADLVDLLWMELSSDAHSLGWSILTRATLDSHETSGMATFKAGGDLEPLAEAYMIIYRLLKRGWSLFDQRCETI